jgi:hypothetical protein
MPWTRSMARGPGPGWPVHGSTVDSPRGQRQGLAGVWPSGHSGPQRLTARVETERAQRGATGRPLTRAWTTVRRWRTDDGASIVERVRRGSGGEQERA